MRSLPVLALLVLVAAGVGLTSIAVRRPFQDHTATVEHAYRHAKRISSLALFIGLIAALAAAHAASSPSVTGDAAAGRTGTTAVSAAFAFGIAHTGILLVGELTWPKPAGSLRRARLVRRGVLDAVSRWQLRLASGTLIVGLLLLIAGALAAHPDGRSVTVSAAGGRVTGAEAPFAGPDYGVPAAVGLLALTALTGLALWIIAQRPTLGTADDHAELLLRRASTHRVLRGATTAALIALGGLLSVSSMSLSNAASETLELASARRIDVSLWIASLPWIGWVLAVVGALAVVAGLLLQFVRAPRPLVGKATVQGL